MDRFIPCCMGLFSAVAHPVPERRQGWGSARPEGALRVIPYPLGIVEIRAVTRPLAGYTDGVPVFRFETRQRTGNREARATQGGTLPQSLTSFSLSHGAPVKRYRRSRKKQGGKEGGGGAADPWSLQRRARSGHRSKRRGKSNGVFGRGSIRAGEPGSRQGRQRETKRNRRS